MILKIKNFLLPLYRFLLKEYILLNENSIKQPIASKDEYMKIFDDAKNVYYKEIDLIQKSLGYDLDLNWLNDLALHTQVCVKKSRINYQHGRLLYSHLRNYIKINSHNFFNIFETGTARGFSSICMSKALNDSGKKGKIYTVDILPNDKEMYWNIIDDNEKKKTRIELLSKWPNEQKNISFLTGNTTQVLRNINIDRINFAFLDAEHTYESIMSEFNYVHSRQKTGDIIFFDDVTPNLFPDICKAIKKIETKKEYLIEYLNITDQRGYAIAKKL